MNDEKFIIGEYINKTDMKDTITRLILETLNFNLLKIKLENAPTDPAATICQNVHGPCPKNIFDINMLIAPMKKVSPELKDIDDKITTEVRGFINGMK